MIAKRRCEKRAEHDKMLQFKIGDIRVCMRSELPDVLDDYAALYRSYRRDDYVADRSVIQTQVRHGSRSVPGRRRYDVCIDGEVYRSNQRRLEVLPYVEWGINARVIATRSDYLQLHAASLVRDGVGVVLPGIPGAGKSTLAAALLSRGWQYMCDEFALINTKTLRLHPFPKALCIKAGSFEVVRQLNLRLWHDRSYVKFMKGKVGYISSSDMGMGAIASASPIRFVIFPKYTGQSEPHLRAVTRTQSAIALASQALNRHVFGHRTMSILCNIVRDAECFALESGPIKKTCDLLESLVTSR